MPVLDFREGVSMALTEAERKLLEELEATLTAQDPKLASKFSQPVRRVHPSHAIAGVVGVLVGLAGLIVGMASEWWISVIGFVIMLVSVVMAFSSWSHPGGEPKTITNSEPKKADFIARMERRWRDRQEQ
jgi:hypothetical protein